MIDEIELRLRCWGYAYGTWPERDPEDEEEPEGASSIARVTVDRSRESQVVDHRDRRLMIRSAPVARRMIQQQLGKACRVPSWAGGEPMRAPRDHGGHSSPPPDSPEADRIEHVVLALQRWDRRAALALRAHYCLLGRRPLSERIAWVAEKSDTKVSRMGYRAALARARLNIAGALMKKTG